MKKENVTIGLACFFAGMVAGFFIAPMKGGVYCGNNNTTCCGSKEIDSNKEAVEKELQGEI